MLIKHRKYSGPTVQVSMLKYSEFYSYVWNFIHIFKISLSHSFFQQKYVHCFCYMHFSALDISSIVQSIL